MPRIGKRIIKTAIAVYICLLIFVIVTVINPEFADAWFAPFFACSAAVYSITVDRKQGITEAKDRIITSTIGGVYAVLIILVYEYIMSTFFSGLNENVDLAIRYTVVAFMFLILMYLITVFKQKKSFFLIISTYIGITVSLRGDHTIFEHGFARIFSTIIGIVIALSINLIQFPRRKNKNIMFLIGFDEMYKNNESLKSYIHYNLFSLIRNESNIIFYSTYDAQTFIDKVEDLPMLKPVILLNGAVVYDFHNRKFLYSVTLDNEKVNYLENLFKSYSFSPFYNVVKDNLHYVYTGCITNQMEEDYLDSKKNSIHITYLIGCCINHAPVYISIVEKVEVINELFKIIKNGEHGDDFHLVIKKLDKNNSYVLQIFNKDINKMECLDYLKEYIDTDTTLAIGTNYKDDNIFNHSDKEYRITKTSEVKAIKKLFKEINKTYHSKEYSKKSLD
ncbi:MAG: hypothetical protein ACRC5M_05370 [Anaeroplasmataceae bacterium]